MAGKFDVAPLPGKDGPGVSSLGGHSYGIATNAENKGTAAKFVKFMSSVEEQKATLMASSNAPVAESLYSDPEVVKQFPYMPILKKSIETAVPRPMRSSTATSRWLSRTPPTAHSRAKQHLMRPSQVCKPSWGR